MSDKITHDSRRVIFEKKHARGTVILLAGELSNGMYGVSFRLSGTDGVENVYTETHDWELYKKAGKFHFSKCFVEFSYKVGDCIVTPVLIGIEGFQESEE